VPLARGDGHEDRHALGGGAREDAVAVLVEGVHRQMAMRIGGDHVVSPSGAGGAGRQEVRGRGPGWARRARARRTRAQRTRVPGGTSRSNPITTGPSPPSAARSMPWDSTPRSFAGLRLATITIVRPTSSSGAYFAA